MYEKSCVKNEIEFNKIYRLEKYYRRFNKEHPNYFRPDGLIVFTGVQGSGKTLSAVKYVENILLKYPLCKLVTNIKLVDFPIDNERVFWFGGGSDLSKYNNGEYGVLYFIDEIQLYFNSLESKNIDPDVMTEISQQRKQRKHIVATSQVFGRMAKPLREQFSSVVACKKFFNRLVINKYFDVNNIDLDADSMHIKGKVDKWQFYIFDPIDFNKYDTYEKVKTFKNVQMKGVNYANRYNVTSNNV